MNRSTIAIPGFGIQLAIPGFGNKHAAAGINAMVSYIPSIRAK